MPSSPQVVPTVVLFDYLLDDLGKALANQRVTVVLSTTQPATSIAPLTTLSPAEQSTTTDLNGYWQFALVPNTNIAPANTIYAVTTPTSSYLVTLGAAGPYQSTAIGVIVNAPVALGPLAVGAGHLSSLIVDGALTDTAGPVTLPAASVADAALSANVALLNRNNAFSAPQRFGGTTDKAKYLYTPQGWDDVWRTALAAQATTPVGVTFNGDSITQGYTASDFLTKSYPGLIRANLLARAGVSLHGDFYATYDSDDFVNAYTGGGTFPWQGIPPWVITVNPGGGARVYAMVGFTLIAQWPGVIASGTEMAKFTPPYNTNALDIVYWNLGAGGGTWYYSIDGAAAVAVTHTGTAGVARVQLRSLTSGVAHVIRIAGQSGTNVATAQGIMAYNTQSGNPPAGGVWFGRLAWGGATISALGKTTTGNPVDHLALFANTTPIGPPLGPSLIFNAFIAGDAIVDSVGNRNGLDHFQYNQRRFLEACRQAIPFASQMFVVPMLSDSYYSDSNNIPLAQNYHLWIARKKQIADEENCALANFQALYGQTPVASGFQKSAGDIHPSDLGHSTYATPILGVV
jgi:hypothetical protein